MGQFYSLTFTGVAVTAQQDLFSFVAPTTGIAVIHSVEISQSTDYGDAQAEGLTILHKRGATTVGSAGSVGVIAPLEGGFATARSTLPRVNDTTVASAGTISTLRASTWSVQQPYLWIPTPEIRHVIAPGVRYVVGLASTPGDSLTCSGELILEEVG